MSSLPSLQEPTLSWLWPDDEAGRKSGNYAAAVTLGLILALHAALLLSPPSSGVTVPLGDTPLAMEFRRVAPSPPPEPEQAQPKPEMRKLLSEVAEPARLVVPEPLKPEPKPEPKPTPKPVKPKPEKPRSVVEKSAPVPVGIPLTQAGVVADTAPPRQNHGPRLRAGGSQAGYHGSRSGGPAPCGGSQQELPPSGAAGGN